MNLGENNNFFRESFRGFNKDDVAEYIAKLSKDYAANEEKYKEHITKLKLDLEARGEGADDFSADPDSKAAQLQSQLIELEEISQNNREEISRLADELNEKSLTISDLQFQLETAKYSASDIPVSDSDSDSGSGSDEIAKYQEMIGTLSKEIEQLKEENEKFEAVPLSAQSAQSDNSNQIDLSETVNQLSFQLAECESEKSYLFNLLKKLSYRTRKLEAVIKCSPPIR